MASRRIGQLRLPLAAHEPGVHCPGSLAVREWATTLSETAIMNLDLISRKLQRRNGITSYGS